jgi:hypothetical protein
MNTQTETVGVRGHQLFSKEVPSTLEIWRLDEKKTFPVCGTGESQSVSDHSHLLIEQARRTLYFYALACQKVNSDFASSQIFP